MNSPIFHPINLQQEDLSYLLPFLVPSAERMRLHKPVGYYAFSFPHLFGTLYAALVLYPLRLSTGHEQYLFRIGFQPSHLHIPDEICAAGI